MTMIKCVILVVATIICLQHQVVLSADLNKAIKYFLKESVNEILQNEPVVKLVYLGYYRSKFHLSHMTDTGKHGAIIDTMRQQPASPSYSSNKMMYYAPQYRDHHNSDLAILAFNMEKIFPCIVGKSVMPMCRLYTYEEDGFRGGRPIIEAGDTGNNLKMFDQKSVYGFSIKDCKQFTSSCMPEWWQTTITCMLPRKYCAS